MPSTANALITTHNLQTRKAPHLSACRCCGGKNCRYCHRAICRDCRRCLHHCRCEPEERPAAA